MFSTTPPSASGKKGTPATAHAHELVRRLGGPLLGGNRVELMRGSAAWQSMLQAIAEAHDHVNLEIDLIDVTGPGDALARQLVERCRDGVRVNLLFDNLGSMSRASEFFSGLHRVGVSLCEYSPLQRLQARLSRSFGLREHRSLLAVDGRIGFLGGVETGPLADESASEAQHLRVEGPAVQRLQRLFISHWQHHASSAMQQARYFPALAPAGGQRVALAASAELHGPSPYRDALLGAVEQSQQQILLAISGPVDNELLTALEHAARRGVSLELLRGAQRLASAQAARLDASGARVHEGRTQTHAAVIDGVWTSVGACSARPAQASRVALIVIDEGFAASLSARLRHQMIPARQATTAGSQGRPWWARWGTSLARGLQSLP